MLRQLALGSHQCLQPGPGQCMQLLLGLFQVWLQLGVALLPLFPEVAPAPVAPHDAEQLPVGLFLVQLQPGVVLLPPPPVVVPAPDLTHAMLHCSGQADSAGQLLP